MWLLYISTIFYKKYEKDQTFIKTNDTIALFHIAHFALKCTYRILVKSQLFNFSIIKNEVKTGKWLDFKLELNFSQLQCSFAIRKTKTSCNSDKFVSIFWTKFLASKGHWCRIEFDVISNDVTNMGLPLSVYTVHLLFALNLTVWA